MVAAVIILPIIPSVPLMLYTKFEKVSNLMSQVSSTFIWLAGGSLVNVRLLLSAEHFSVPGGLADAADANVLWHVKHGGAIPTAIDGDHHSSYQNLCGAA